MSEISKETIFTYTDSANPHLRLLEEAFEGLEPEERIERIEIDGDLVNFGRKPSLDDEFRRLQGDEDIEKELESLKSKTKKK